MGTRTVAFVIALAAVPADVLAHRHTMECFAGGSLSSEEEADDDTEERVSIYCAGLVNEVFNDVGATAGYEESGPFFYTGDFRIDSSGNMESFLSASFMDLGGRAEPFVRLGVGGFRTDANGDTDFAALLGGGVDLQLNPCPDGIDHCGTVYVLRGQVEMVSVWGTPHRVFPRAQFAFGARFNFDRD